MKEFVIWGRPPSKDAEELLVSEHAGIATRDHAERVKSTLETEHGCTAVRIQELDLSKPLDFVGLALGRSR